MAIFSKVFGISDLIRSILLNFVFEIVFKKYITELRASKWGKLLSKSS